MRWRFNCVLMAAMASLGLCSPTDADLVALYTFDEGSGSTAQDSATNEGFQTAQQNQGTIGWTTEGVIGGALDLPGDASLQAADAIGEGATALTIAVWVNMDDTPGYDGIYSARRPPGEGANQENWGLNINGGNADDLAYDYRYDNAPIGTGGSVGVDSAPGSAVVGEWQHIAMTWTAEADEASPDFSRYVYLNGVNVGTAPAGNIDTEYHGFLSTWNIGDDPCCGGRELDAQLDDLAVWDEALTDADILGIYNNGLQGIGVPPPPPIGTLGDVNLDDLVNSVDFNVIRQNLLQPFTERTDGDLVNDDFIDFSDYAQWKQVSPKDPGSAAVPEPSSVVLLILAGAAGLACLRR